MQPAYPYLRQVKSEPTRSTTSGAAGRSRSLLHSLPIRFHVISPQPSSH